MSKADIVDYVSNETNLSKMESKALVDIVFDGIVNVLGAEGKLSIVNFGSFYLVERKATVARNPRTGEKVNVPEKTVLRFKPATALKKLF